MHLPWNFVLELAFQSVTQSSTLEFQPGIFSEYLKTGNNNRKRMKNN